MGCLAGGWTARLVRLAQPLRSSASAAAPTAAAPSLRCLRRTVPIRAGVALYGEAIVEPLSSAMSMSPSQVAR